MSASEHPFPHSVASDRPLTDPSQDVYGYADYARNLAAAILKTPSPEGLVMAVHGAWGSGKSTLLNFIKYELDRNHGRSGATIIEFNPWWFQGHEDLAGQLLAQFSAQLPDSGGAFRYLGNLLADYSDGLAKAAATITVHPLAAPFLSRALKWLRSKPPDVPKLKANLAQLLRDSGKRFVFVIDDIDRLDAQEVRALFKVLKALADFPNVIYLLAFDRLAVAKVLSASTGTSGDLYLEKIIQAPFALPPIDERRLWTEFDRSVNRILAACDVKHVDVNYWRRVFFSGLNRHLLKPRDVVRIVNVIAVTYPPVAGEVNFVDFIALEFVRLFEPDLYTAIRDNQAYFTGFPDRLDERIRAVEKDFHEAWLALLPEARRASARSLVLALFPRLSAIWKNTWYSGEQAVKARKDLRVCSPEHFGTYFRFSAPDTRVSQRELREFLRQGSSVDALISVLRSAAQAKLQVGVSKTQSYLDELRFVDGFAPGTPENILHALYAVADEMYPRPWDDAFVRYYWRLFWLVEYLLEKMATDVRAEFLAQCLGESKAPAFVFYTAYLIQETRKDTKVPPDSVFLNFTEQDERRFVKIMREKLRALSAEELATLPELRIIAPVWKTIDDITYVIARMKEILESDALLPIVLEQFLTRGSCQSVEDPVPTVVVQLNPKDLADFVDLDAEEKLVEQMLVREDLTSHQREGGRQFLRGMDQLRRGVNPTSPAGVLENAELDKPANSD